MKHHGGTRRAKLAFGVLTALVVGGFGAVVPFNGTAVAIGGLCEGRPATHPWLDASGQPGPSLLEGTPGDDVIVGGDGDDRIFGGGGNDIICGGPGDDDLGTVGVVHSITMFGGSGDDGPNVGDTLAPSFVSGGSGDDTLQHGGTGAIVKLSGEDGIDRCIFRAGDELSSCEL